MKYLITGGAGFIGSHLADHLISDGQEVVAIDNLSTGSVSNIEHLLGHKRFAFSEGDILDIPFLAQHVQSCDQIFHLAAAVGVRRIMEAPVETIVTNVNGSENVLKLAHKYGKKVMLASTSEVYGKLMDSDESGQGELLSEDGDWRLGATSRRRWAYACSKALDEFLALAYYMEKDLPVVIVRFFNTVGPRQTGRYGMVIPRFVESALRGEPITVYGDGNQTRSFTYVGDVIDAIVKLMDEPEAEGEVINVGNACEISMNDLAVRVKSLTGSTSEIIRVPYERVYGPGFEDMRRRTPDLSKIKQLIGYEPTHDTDDILRETVAYFRQRDAGKERRVAGASW